ncbi:hypothetical protein FSPOR_6660 [Fusarium sporotrichioides]|uniref:Uncharacterized protein n=1 Tax=Fusarium sporotrichioides TaxID=5514 RepID=A0A395S2F8_FUSSP|nr:hypothetical protein FSPOR_6660 [Fusarium sporotrichioides]
MPTATEFFGIGANNLGPLTTTYTAPPSCTATTNTDHILFANATSPYLDYVMSSSCEAKPFGDCYPSGKKYDSIGKQMTSVGQGVYHYFSPGIACPDGWETAATLKHGSKSGEIDVSGALTVSATSLTSLIVSEFSQALPLHPTDFWRNVLDKSETLAYCCPRGYAGDIHGFCKSTLGPLTRTKSNQPDPAYCRVFVTGKDLVSTITSLDGVTLTNNNGLQSVVPFTGDASTETLTLATWGDDVVTDLVYATWVPAVTLIHKETATGSADDGESDEKKDDESHASSVGKGGVLSVLGVTLGLLAGAGMLTAW